MHPSRRFTAPPSRGQATSPGRPAPAPARAGTPAPPSGAPVPATGDAAAAGAPASVTTPAVGIPAVAGPAVAAPADPGVPAGTRLTPDQGTRLVAGGLVLAGGSPLRVLRLTPSGSRQVAAWLAGVPVPASPAARALARRLLDAGIAHPDYPPVPPSAASGPAAARLPAPVSPAAVSPPPAPGPAEVTVVIPVRDRHAELDRCLAGLRGLPHVLVVDDDSADPEVIARIAAARGARVIRRPVNGGPGAARNTGLAAVRTAFVAFLDSDCVPAPGWLDGLLPHFADPAVGAVAPRIVPHQAGSGWLARYEGASSTLDMGARPSIVRPGARVSYVPGAALVVRKAAAGDGFADGMRVGEDVDFVWRLAAAGWRVRYEPRASMGHDHRVSLRAWFSRRSDYGTSAAALEERHPGAVRPLHASWWTVGAWAAALAGRPATAAALTGAATALLARRLSRVTGERWPLPLGSADSSADNSKKNEAPGRLGHVRSDVTRMADSFRHPGVENHPPSGQPTPDVADNSKKRPDAAGPDGPGSRPPEFAAWRLAARLAGGGTLASGRPIGSALTRTWLPVALPAALAVRRLRLPLAALVLLPPLLDWADRRPPLDPARYVAARLLDDVAYSTGVWRGCLARRTAGPLLPRIGSRPSGQAPAPPPG